MIADGRQLTFEEEVLGMSDEQLVALLSMGEHLLRSDRAWYRWDRERLRTQVRTYAAELRRRKRQSRPAD